MFSKSNLMKSVLNDTYHKYMKNFDSVLYNDELTKKPKKDSNKIRVEYPSSEAKFSTTPDLPEYKDFKFNSDTESAIKSISDKLEVPEKDIRYIFAIESGGRSNALNKSRTAAGLIQFFADNPNDSYNNRYKTIKGKKYFLKDIENMSAKEQVPLVLDYLEGVGVKKGENFYDMYTSIFYPKAKGKSDEYRLGSEHKNPLQRMNAIAKQNKHYDSDYDVNSNRNFITNKEFKEGAKKAIDTYYNQWKKQNKNKLFNT